MSARSANPRTYQRRTLSEETRRRLTALIAKRGCDRTADLLGTSVETMKSAAAGLPMLTGTAARLEERLDKLLEAPR